MAKNNKNNATFQVEPGSLMEIVSQGGKRIISFRMLGEPPVQQHHRIAFRGIRRGWWVGRGQAFLYDPCSRQKSQYREALLAAFQDLQLVTIPSFLRATPLRLVVNFVCSRPITANQLFPTKKDVDNMVKFIMDAFQNVLYFDDKVIVTVNSRKTFPTAGSPVPAWTDMSVGTADLTTTDF